MLRKTIRLAIAPALLLATAGPALAQEQDPQLWTTATATLPLGDDLELTGDFITRSSDLRDGIYQIHVAGDLRYRASDKVTLSVGFSHIPNHEGGAHVTTENRVRQQVNAKLANVAGGTVSGRLRLEQRWRDDGEDLKFRLRPSVAWTGDIAPDVALELRHESFVNLNDTDWGPASGYDRMRQYVSLERPLGGGLTGEIGYINQYVFGREDPDEMDHILALGLTYGF